MKRTFSILLICTLVCYNLTVLAQRSEPYIYGEMGGGFGTHGTGKLVMNMIFEGNNIVSVGYYTSSRRWSGTPPDYEVGFLSSYPRQIINMIGISYGKVFFTGTHGARWVIKGGLAMGEVKTPTDFEPFRSLLGPNYTYNYTIDITPGLIINPAIELPVGRGFGFSFGAYANINVISPVVGLDASLIFGRVSDRRTRSGKK